MVSETAWPNHPPMLAPELRRLQKPAPAPPHTAHLFLSMTQVPTWHSGGLPTSPGVALGTVAYMSPAAHARGIGGYNPDLETAWGKELKTAEALEERAAEKLHSKRFIICVARSRRPQVECLSTAARVQLWH